MYHSFLPWLRQESGELRADDGSVQAGQATPSRPSRRGADVVVVNTCGFLASACEEAIENILEMAELKRRGR